MTQVLEYITQNYTLFLFGAIVILLAIIGYYAEKTNFAQGKTDKTKEGKTTNKEINLNNTRLMDITNNVENTHENGIENEIQNTNTNLVEGKNNTTSDVLYQEEIVEEKTINNESGLLENSENTIIVDEEKKEITNPIIDAIHKELNLLGNDVIFNSEELKIKETKSKKREEEFNKFSDEFDALLPEREFINDDLLSEIEDLELGKTQKFDLKDLKQFDNIKLPRISDTGLEEQDIWKF